MAVEGFGGGTELALAKLPQSQHQVLGDLASLGQYLTQALLRRLGEGKVTDSRVVFVLHTAHTLGRVIALSSDSDVVVARVQESPVISIRCCDKANKIPLLHVPEFPVFPLNTHST